MSAYSTGEALDSQNREASNVRTMSISEDKIITETGGFIWGEPLKWRVAEIKVLEKRIRSGKVTERISGVSVN